MPDLPLPPTPSAHASQTNIHELVLPRLRLLLVVLLLPLPFDSTRPYSYNYEQSNLMYSQNRVISVFPPLTGHGATKRQSRYPLQKIALNASI